LQTVLVLLNHFVIKTLVVLKSERKKQQKERKERKKERKKKKKKLSTPSRQIQ
jgi:hypothetical protein